MSDQRGLAPQTFDYAVIETEPATLAREVADKIRTHQRRTSAEVIEIGTDLIKVKSALKGRFVSWLDAEFGWTARTARNYMLAAERFGAKTETVSVLPPTTIYLLAKETTPTTIVTDVLSKLEDGQQINPKVIKAEIVEATWQAKHNRSLADIKAERSRRRAKRRGQLTPQAERRIERKREKEEAAVQQRRSDAAIVAQQLISKHGASRVRAILDGADDVFVRRALEDILRGHEQRRLAS